jgi:hypothetical protein
MGDNLPAIDLGTGRTATAIAAGKWHTCALLDNSSVKCWGSGDQGRLGQGDTNRRGDNAGEMGDNLSAVDLGTLAATSATVTGLSSATSYTFRVSAVNDQGSSVPSGTATAWPDITSPTLTEKWPFPGCGPEDGCYASEPQLLQCSYVLKLTFSEPVFSAAPGEWTWDPGLNPAYGLIQVYNRSVSGSFAQWNDAGDDSITVSGLGSDTLYLVLDDGMCVASNPREWGARIAPNALQDAAGNTFSGITGYYDWTWAVVNPPSNPYGQYSYPPGYPSP